MKLCQKCASKPILITNNVLPTESPKIISYNLFDRKLDPPTNSSLNWRKKCALIETTINKNMLEREIYKLAIIALPLVVIDRLF